ncbi:MAG: hypothetical protein ACK4MQ_02955 [Hyphomonas sp.]
MKALMMMAAAATLAAAGGCQSNEPSAAYANPVDACAAIADEEDRARCLRNVVADVASSTKREKERRKGP